MFQGHVLIVDEHLESVQRIGFLLRLTGCQITLAHTVGEGINWITSLHQESRYFDLILINNVARSTDLFSLCEMTGRVAVRLDVLLIDRQDFIEIIEDICASSCGRIGSCRSEEVMEYVRQLFRRNGKKVVPTVVA